MTSEIIIYLEKLPIYVSLENHTKFFSTYMSLCIVRNKLIESNFVKKEYRDNMYFYKKVNNTLKKLKEDDLLDGIIYLYIKEEKDYSESSNILFYLEKRIADFEPIFNKSYEKFIDYQLGNKDKYKNYENITKLWNEFKEYNEDSFEYNNWYFIMKQDGLSILRKMSLDIKKWIKNKEKIMTEIEIIYLNELEYKVNDEDFTFINNYINL